MKVACYSHTQLLYTFCLVLSFHFVLQGTRYEAVYDYTAKHNDEVSFIQGDMILFPSFSNDDGWMEGYIQRTGKRGLFPLNYVQKLF